MRTIPLHSIPSPKENSERSVLLISWIGGGLLWFLHLMASYVVSEFGCLSGLASEDFLGIQAVTWIVIAITIILLGLIMGLMLWTWKKTRLKTANSGSIDMRQVSLIGSGVFAALIVFESLPILFFLRGC